jgi:hypothetical protein
VLNNRYTGIPLFLKSCDPGGEKKHCVKMGDITNGLEELRNTKSRFGD